jgi:cytochrome P450
LGCTTDVSIRAILHDEGAYPEPLKFNPERFENREKNRLAGINELPEAAFGFGRR